MARQSQPEYEPVRGYVLKEMYLRLKSKLALRGMTFSAWLRRKVQEEVDGED